MEGMSSRTMSHQAAEDLAFALGKYAYSPAKRTLPVTPRAVKEEPANEAGPSRSPSTPRQFTQKTTSRGVSSGSAGRKPKVKEGSDDEYAHDAHTPSPSNGRAKGKAKSPGSGKKPRPYAGPEVYAHLKPVPDHMGVDMDIVFCGINPGRKSSTAGHHFAHPTNKFWRALHLSGLTDRLYSPSEDHLLPHHFRFGLTNLCGRPTAEQSELSTVEMKLNVLPFTIKLLQFRPKVVCFVGKKIWDVYESVAKRTAISATSSNEPQVEEIRKDEELLVKVEDDTAASSQTPARAKRKRASSTPKVKQPFDWSRPRALRLPLPLAPISLVAGPEEVKPDVSDGTEQEYCYFWVVPNTSGLERTPLSEQVVLFSHLRAFSEGLKSGIPPDAEFWDIDVVGLERTNDAIAATALAKTPKQ